MFQESIQDIIRETLKGLVDNGKLSVSDKHGLNLIHEPVVEIPRDETHGDFASNIAMMLAKTAKKPPRAIAELIKETIDHKHYEVIQETNIAGPGFLNFKLTYKAFHNVLSEIHTQSANWGRSNIGKGEKVLLEFVSANPTGPLNVVNARAATVGDVLANLFEHCGYDVDREYYVNDEGSQIDNLGKSLHARFLELQGKPLVLPDDGYHGEYLIDIARSLVDDAKSSKKDLTSLELLDKFPEQLTWWSEEAVVRLLSLQRKAMERFGVNFKKFYRQSELTSVNKHLESFKKLQDNGFIYEKDGAFWLSTTRFGDDKDRVLVRSTGEHTYFSVDIAYHFNKAERGYNHLINLLGPDHHGYIPRLKACMQALGCPKELLEVYIIQQVTLLKNGEPVKMSKRAGEFITMDDLIDELGNGDDEVGKNAARFFFNLRHRDSPLEFDLDLAKEQSDKNPLFYVQYAHARIKSILRNAKEQGVHVPSDMTLVDLEPLSSDEEKTLIKTISRFPAIVKLCMEKREPHHLTTYGAELSRAMHSFYSVHRVLPPTPSSVAREDLLGLSEGESDLEGIARTPSLTIEQSQARLALIDAVRLTITNLLAIMGISAPDKM